MPHAMRSFYNIYKTPYAAADICVLIIRTSWMSGFPDLYVEIYRAISMLLLPLFYSPCWASEETLITSA